jgi:CRP-like cAMP-binding protein
MHPLFYYINKYAIISVEDFNFLSKHFIHKKIKKKQYLQEEGEICAHMAFVVKGAMRQYYTDEKGVEHVVNLYVEKFWVGDRESFIMRTPSLYSIEAWEDCELLLISSADTLQLRSQCHPFNELLLALDEENSIITQRRLTYSICFQAEMRYKFFVDCYPYFVDRFPQHIIASYLGITKDTLSRVRKKIRKKS